MADLRVDPARRDLDETTGIYIRALDEGRWVSIDIATLDRESLDAWLREREDIEWPISVVMLLLGHPAKGEPGEAAGQEAAPGGVRSGAGTAEEGVVMDGPIPVPTRTMAMRLTGDNAEQVLEWVADYVDQSDAFVRRTEAGCVINLGVCGKRVRVAFEDDWVVIDYLTGKVHTIPTGWRAVALGLEQEGEG